MDNSNEYRKECLKRHYQNMTIKKARRLHSEFLEQSKKKAKIFAKRINAAKGYKAI